MTEEFRRLRALVEGAAAGPPAERAAWLERECAGDEALLERARKVLDDALRDDPFLTPLPAAAPAPELGAGARVGPFTLTRVLGAGGMGTVYEAEQAEPRRRVALKIMHGGPVSAASRERFRYEVEILAALRHPGIAQVYESGVRAEAGRELPWFAMEFVEGAETIVEHASRLGLALPDRLRLFAEICAAVDHGHRRGVIHRDLKPDNILVDREGRVKVIDFGIARAADGPTSTLTGEILGTLSYMSPEQFLGSRAAVDTRSDVYSLGVVLYQLLTGDLPYRVDPRDMVAMVQAIRETPPARPARVPRDLETIVLKCLEKDAARRYGSAHALEQDLRRFLAREPISARPPSAIYQLRMLARRHRVASAALAVALVAIVAGLVTSIRFALAAERDRAEASLRAYAASIAAADASLMIHQIDDARRCLGGAPEAHRGWEWEHLVHQLDLSEATLRWPGYHALALACAPDGERLACAAMNAGTGEGVVQVRDGGEARFDIRPKVLVRALAFAPGGEVLALGAADGTVHLYRGETCMGVFPAHTGAVTTVAFDGPRIVSGGESGAVRVLDWATGAELPGFAMPAGVVAATAGRAISRDGTLRLADGRTHALPTKPAAAAFTRDGRLVAVGGKDSTVRVYETESGRALATMSGHMAAPHSVAFSPDGARVVSGAGDGTVRIWEVASARCVSVLHGHVSSTVVAVAFRPDGARVASADVTGDTKLWDARPRESAPTLRHRATGLAFDRGGTRLATCADDGTVAIWDIESHERTATFVAEGDALHSVAFAPDGARVLAGGKQGALYAWDLLTGQLAVRRELGQGTVHAVAFVPDGSAILTGGADGTVASWDPALAPLGRWQRHEGRISALVVDQAGRRVVSSGADGVIRVSDPRGESLTTLGSHEKVSSLAFSHGGGLLASGGADVTTRLWDPERGVEVGRLDQTGVAGFMPKRLVTIDALQLKVWDVETRTLMATLRGHRWFVARALVSPDGRTIASIGREFATGECEIKLWEAGRR